MDKKRIIRIASIGLQGFKNVDRGRIDFPLYKEGRRSVEEAEIVGLYGQNGSGKTAVIDAVHFMQLLMLGQSLKDSQIEDYLNSETGMAELELTFLVETAVWQGYLTYKVVICKNDVGKGFVRQEELSAVRYEQDKRQQKTLLLRYEGTKSEIFTPKKLLNLFVFNKQEAQMKLQLSRMLSEKTQTSFIFSNMTLEEFAKQDRVEVKEIALLLTQLRSFAVGDLFVVRTNHTGLISANFILPLFFKMNNFAGGLKGDLDIPLNGPFLWPLMGKALLEKLVMQVNLVLKTIIPGMQLEIKNYGEQMLDDGKAGVRIELISQREDKPAIPIRMESAGIIKIISVLQAVIMAFANPSICLFIDELDAGIYEYMLGEILKTFSVHAQGQLFFTSHNLRPLEMLDKRSIVFSTANPQNRYIRFAGLKSCNNLRDQYIRAITLGGQKESLYDETDSLQMSKAFIKAGRMLRDEQEGSSVLG